MVTQDPLPLFAASGATSDPPAQRADGAAASPARFAAVSQASKRQRPLEATISPHLIEARRLSRRMRALKDRADAQTVTGRAICQHLRLLLQESERPASH
jgi:hypothetical protein